MSLKLSCNRDLNYLLSEPMHTYAVFAYIIMIIILAYALLILFKVAPRGAAQLAFAMI